MLAATFLKLMSESWGKVWRRIISDLLWEVIGPNNVSITTRGEMFKHGIKKSNHYIIKRNNARETWKHTQNSRQDLFFWILRNSCRPSCARPNLNVHHSISVGDSNIFSAFPVQLTKNSQVNFCCICFQSRLLGQHNTRNIFWILNHSSNIQ